MKIKERMSDIFDKYINALDGQSEAQQNTKEGVKLILDTIESMYIDVATFYEELEATDEN